jgi:phosphotransferase system HPr-like phosphotransfer protein
MPGTRPAAETEQAFQDFEQYIRFIQSQAGVRFVTATELMTVYADQAMTHSFRREDLVRFARSVQKDITFQRLDGYTLSAADVFGLLTDATAAFVERQEWPSATQVTPLDGPARSFSPSTGGGRSSNFGWRAFAQAVRETSDYCRTSHRLPDEVWIGAESLSPADYLATLAGTFEELIASGKTPTDVMRREGHYTADRYVAEDSPDLWSWPIFPDGFHAPRIMELARLQAWTLKPAILH